MSSLTQDFIDAKGLVEKYDLHAFIETGCESGVGLSVAYDLGLALYSCDVNAECVDACRRLFPTAQISHAYSEDFLLDTLPQIHQPALVWLDAHFSPLADDARQWPLLRELYHLKNLLATVDQSVILCDDFATVMHERLEDPDPNRYQGARDFCDYTLGDIIRLFPHHNYEVLAQNTGVLKLMPK